MGRLFVILLEPEWEPLVSAGTWPMFPATMEWLRVRELVLVTPLPVNAEFPVMVVC